MLALRTSDGLDLAALGTRYGPQVANRVVRGLQDYIEKGLVVASRVDGGESASRTTVDAVESIQHVRLKDPEGFLLSNDILFEGNKTQEKIIAALKGKSFSTQITISEFDKTYYARAYAVVEGKTKTGKIARIRLDGPYDIPFNAKLVDFGWYESGWFGTFKRANENWIFHTELTWLYVESSSSIGTWFWSEKLGLGWSRKDLWPYIWKNSPEGWVYFFGNQDGTLTF